MLYRIAVSITDFFVRNNIINKEDDEIYAYGFDLMMSGLIGIVLVLITGAMIHRVWMAAIFLILIIPIRMFTGGYHADTHIMCNVMFVITYLFTVLLFDFLTCTNQVDKFNVGVLTMNAYDEKGWVWGCSIFFVCIGAVIVAATAPVRNYNKVISVHQKKQYKRTALVLYLLTAIISILLSILSRLYFKGISWLEEVGLYINIMLIAIVILMIIGIGKEKSHERKSIKDNR